MPLADWDTLSFELIAITGFLHAPNTTLMPDEMAFRQYFELIAGCTVFIG